MWYPHINRSSRQVSLYCKFNFCAWVCTLICFLSKPSIIQSLEKLYDCTCLSKSVRNSWEATGVYIYVKSVSWELTQYLQGLSLLALRGVSKPNTPTGSRRLMSSSGREIEVAMERGRGKSASQYTKPSIIIFELAPKLVGVNYL